MAESDVERAKGPDALGDATDSAIQQLALELWKAPPLQQAVEVLGLAIQHLRSERDRLTRELREAQELYRVAREKRVSELAEVADLRAKLAAAVKDRVAFETRISARLAELQRENERLRLKDPMRFIEELDEKNELARHAAKTEAALAAEREMVRRLRANEHDKGCITETEATYPCDCSLNADGVRAQEPQPK